MNSEICFYFNMLYKIFYFVRFRDTVYLVIWSDEMWLYHQNQKKIKIIMTVFWNSIWDKGNR